MLFYRIIDTGMSTIHRLKPHCQGYCTAYSKAIHWTVDLNESGSLKILIFFQRHLPLKNLL